MSQLSLFSADLAEPRPEDLGGLLAAHGHIAHGSPGPRLSILLEDTWRAEALVRECRVRDIHADIVPLADTDQHRGADSAAVLLRTGRIPELLPLAAAWFRGAVKAVPDEFVIGAGLLRCWTLAAGRVGASGFHFGLDPHAPDMYEPLAAACARAGIAGSIIGVAAGRPVLRVVGHKRVMRLVELLGTPPPNAPAGVFPTPDR